MTQNLPAHLQQYTTPDIAGALAANLGSAMPPHVSIEGNKFTLIDAANAAIPVPTFDPQIGPYLDAAIIDVNPVMSRIYFGGNYDNAAEGVRPECFSDNGIGPSMSAGSPQAPTCAACPRSEWTKVNQNGKKVPWCTQKQKVALLIPGFPTLFLLAVPPGSHGSMREYVNLCQGNGANIADLLTRIWFVSQGVLGFKPMSYIDAPTAQLRQAAYAEKKTDALVGRTDVARPPGNHPAAIAAPATQPTIATMTVLPPDSTPEQVAATFAGLPQVQQPAPFAPPSGQTQPQPNAAWPTTQAGPAAVTQQTAPASAEPAPARRRRRTAAEMAQAAPQAPNSASPAPTAPFPHPGGQPAPAPPMGFPPSTQPGALPGQTDMGFGMAAGQPASANPALAGMLDDFFKN